MKKIIPVLIIGVLLISGLGAVALPEADGNTLIEKTESMLVSEPIVREESDCISVELEEATSFLTETKMPMLPKITNVYALPIGSTVTDVVVEFSEVEKLGLSKEIKRVPEPIIEGTNTIKTESLTKEAFDSDIYPDSTYSYRICTGLYNGIRQALLIVHCYPIRYSFSENALYYSDSFEITFNYKEPSSPITFAGVYDLVVIAPSEFEQALQPLIEHKNDHGMNTTLVTLEEIYDNYTEGRDEQENIKLFLYDAIKPDGLNWNITYVLLVGGMKGQQREFYLPVRYTNNHAGAPSETGFISDLYYADILKDNGTAFEDWDSNGNGIFAEYKIGSKDIIDGTPDVYVGRLACRSLRQVKTMVNKIIDYEEGLAADSWFKNMLLIGGDTYPDNGHPDAYEAELDTNVSASYMDGFEFERLWASLETLTGQRSVVKAINGGAGFIHMAGHANPSILVTHPPNDKSSKILILKIYAFPPIDALWALFRGQGIAEVLEKLFSPVLPILTNGEKQPVIVVGGCHNSQFNTTIMNIVKDGFQHAYGYGDYVPKCWSWWLTSKERGGAIATMGNSGLGMGLPGFEYPNGLDGWLLPRFFYNYGQLGKEHVGEAHSAAIADYVIQFDINNNDADRQMVEQWVLLGDPSLMIGGYE